MRRHTIKNALRALGATTVAVVALVAILTVGSALGSSSGNSGNSQQTAGPDAGASFAVFNETSPQSARETSWITEDLPAFIEPTSVRLAQNTPDGEIGVVAGSGSVCAYAREPAFARGGGCASVATASNGIQPILGTIPAPGGRKLLFGLFPNGVSTATASAAGTSVQANIANNTINVNVGDGPVTVSWTAPDGIPQQLTVIH
jgi:hypothetical protein